MRLIQSASQLAARDALLIGPAHLGELAPQVIDVPAHVAAGGSARRMKASTLRPVRESRSIEAECACSLTAADQLRAWVVSSPMNTLSHPDAPSTRTAPLAPSHRTLPLTRLYQRSSTPVGGASHRPGVAGRRQPGNPRIGLALLTHTRAAGRRPPGTPNSSN
jgi:hypothetical protein